MIKSNTPKRAMLIPQSAAMDDSSGYYVWGVTPENTAVRKDIKVSEEIDKNWIVTEGLTEDDVIIGKGIQSIRQPGQPVNSAPLNNAGTADKK